MIKEIILNGEKIKYDLERKRVKNINVRIKPSGEVCVSVSPWVTQKTIESFLVKKSDFIISALKKYEDKAKKSKEQYFKESEIGSVILSLCEEVYPYFKNRGVKFPEIKFRKMVSQWGNCRAEKGVLTFNINLMYAPLNCIKYVVIHEFTHFLQANHSKKFYDELFLACPDWKECRKLLKEISLR